MIPLAHVCAINTKVTRHQGGPGMLCVIDFLLNSFLNLTVSKGNTQITMAIYFFLRNSYENNSIDNGIKRNKILGN